MCDPSRSSGEAQTRLPADRAFVIRLRADADPRHDDLQGLVEHVASGRRQRFRGLAGLEAFVGAVLAAVAGREQDDNP